MHKKLKLLVTIMLLTMSVCVFSQTGTGTMMGTVNDQQDAVVSDVNVTITSPALMGERSTTTNSRGVYRFINLAPGVYNISFSKDGYNQYEQNGITINSSKTSAINVALQLGDFEETITITADAPMIDPTQPGSQIILSGELQNALAINPSATWTDVLMVTPGITADARTIDKTYNQFSVQGSDSDFGSGWSIDGSLVASAGVGAQPKVNISRDIIEEITIDTTKNSSRNISTKGGSFTVISKSGGNDFSGIYSLNYQPVEWNDNNVDEGKPAIAGLTRNSFTLGGPILKDKVWFFANAMFETQRNGYSKDAQTLALMNHYFPGSGDQLGLNENLSGFFKISTQVADNHSIQVTFQPEETYNNLGASYLTPDAYNGRGYNGFSGQAKWLWLVNDELNIDTRVNYFNKATFEGSVNGGSGTRNTYYQDSYLSRGYRYGSNRMMVSGNTYNVIDAELDQWNTEVNVNYYLDDFYGSHEFDIGFSNLSFGESSKDGPYASPRMAYYALNDSNDVYSGFYKFAEFYFPDGGTELGLNTRQVRAGYINDSWQLNSRTVLNVGLRVDLTSQGGHFDEPALDWNGDARGSYSMNLGMTYALNDAATSILRAHYARKITTSYGGAFLAANAYKRGSQYNLYDIDLDGTLEYRKQYGTSSYASGVPEDEYAHLEPSYSDQFTFGFSQELPNQMNLSIDYTHANSTNNIRYMRSNQIYTDGKWAGRVDPSDSAWNYGYFNDPMNRVHDALDIIVNQQLSKNFQMLASFTFAFTRQEGDPEPGSFDWQERPSADYEFNQRYDRGPVAKLAAVYLAPYDFTISLNYQTYGGEWSGRLYEYVTGSHPSYYLSGPASVVQDGMTIRNPNLTTFRRWGSSVMDDQWQADRVHQVNLRVGRVWNYRGYKLETSVDIFNALNNAALADVNSYGLRVSNNDINSNANYGKARYPQRARAFMALLKLSF